VASSFILLVEVVAEQLPMPVEQLELLEELLS
jgi:hypothetical protein